MTFQTGDIIRERTDVPRQGVDASPIPLTYRVEPGYLMALGIDGVERPSAMYDRDDATPALFELVVPE